MRGPLFAPLIYPKARDPGNRREAGSLLAGNICCLSWSAFPDHVSICVHAGDLGLVLYLPDLSSYSPILILNLLPVGNREENLEGL